MNESQSAREAGGGGADLRIEDDDTTNNGKNYHCVCAAAEDDGLHNKETSHRSKLSSYRMMNEISNDNNPNRILTCHKIYKDSMNFKLGVSFENRNNKDYISRITAGSPAEAAGLAPGQLIRTVNGIPIHSALQAATLVFEAPKGFIALETEPPRPFIHGHNTCDGCLIGPIIGKRHSALNLPDYDLCEKCYKKYKGNIVIFEVKEDESDRAFQGSWYRFRERIQEYHDWLENVQENGRQLENAPAEFRADRNIVSAAIRQDIQALQFASDDTKTTKEVQDAIAYQRWMSKVKDNWQNLQNAPAEFRADKRIVIEALQQNSLALYYASDLVRNDKDVVCQYWLSNVQKKGCNLERAPEEVRSNKSVVAAALRQDVRAIEFASEDLQMDEEIKKIVHECWVSILETDGMNLREAPEEFRANKDTVLAAAQKDVRTIRFVSEDLEMDKDLIYFACQYWIPKVAADWKELAEAPKELRANKNIVLIAAKQDAQAIKFASENVKNDKEVKEIEYLYWLSKVKENGMDLRYAPEELCADKKVVLEAMGQNIWAVKFASKSLQEYEDIKRDFEYKTWLSAVQCDGTKLKKVPEILRSDKNIVLAAAQQNIQAMEFADDREMDIDIIYFACQYWIPKVAGDWRELERAPKQLRNTKNLVLIAIQQDVQAMKFASEDLQNDKDLKEIENIYWLSKVKASGLNLRRAPKGIRSNKDVVMVAVQQNGFALYYASASLQNDKDIVHQYWMSKVKENGLNLGEAPDGIRSNKKIVLEAVSQDIQALKFAAAEIKADISRQYWLSMVKTNGMNLCGAPEEIRADKNVVTAAIQENFLALSHACEDLQNDAKILYCYWLSKVKASGMNLREAPDDLRADTNIVRTAIGQDIRALEFACGDAKTLKEIEYHYWLKEVESNGMNLREAPDHLRADTNIVRTAIRHDFRALEFACGDAKTDTEINEIEYHHWLREVQANGMKLREAPEKLQADMRIVREAIGQNIWAFEFASNDIKGNVETHDIAYQYWLSKVQANGMALRDAPENFRCNKSIALTAARQCVLAMEFVPDDLCEDFEIKAISYEYWLLKVQTNGESLCGAPEELRANIKIVLAAIQESHIAIAYVSEELQSNEEVIYHYWLSRVQEKGSDLREAPKEFKANVSIVLAAVRQDISALQFASDDIIRNKEIQGIAYEYWLSEVKANGMSLCNAPEKLRADRFIVIAAVQQHGGALKFACEDLQDDLEIKDISYRYWLSKMAEYGLPTDLLRSLKKSDKNVKDFAFAYWLSKVQENGENLRYAPLEFRADVNIVKAAVEQKAWDSPLQYASSELRNNKMLVMTAIQHDGSAFKYASEDLQNDRAVLHRFWLTKVRHNGQSLRYAPDEFRSVKEIVMAAVKQDGGALKFATEDITKDKDVVLEAVKHNPNATKYVHEDLKRDPDVLIAAGMFDESHDAIQPRNVIKIALSTRFSLSASSRSEATNFTKLFKDHYHIQIGNFKIYAPNAFDKKTCDPNWTNFDHPCRGTKETCQFGDALKTGHPTDDCCWRYSYRHQLNEAKKSGGFMLQLVEKGDDSSKTPSLGNGQRIERDMANELNLKVFHVYRPMSGKGYGWTFEKHHIEEVIAEIRKWYSEGCKDMSECVIRPASGIGMYAMGSSRRIFS